MRARGDYMVRKVCVVTANRAERGLLQPVIRRIAEHPDLKLMLLEIPPGLNFGQIFNYVTETMKKAGIDIALVPCDRKEILAATIAIFYQNIPIAHFHAGDIDSAQHDAVTRHVISMYSTILFCNSELSAKRLIKMGEEPERVYVVGSTAFDDLELDDSLVPNILYDLVLMHPVNQFPKKSKEEIKQVFKMLDKFTVVLYPNYDLGREYIVEEIEKHRGDPNIQIIEKNLPRPQFLSLIKNCERFISNSSSTVYEAPFFGRKVINPSIRNIERESIEIVPGASDKIVKILATADLNIRKKYAHAL